MDLVLLQGCSMKTTHLTALIISVTVISASATAKPSKCAKYKDKYKAIQAKQKQPNKVKKSNQLKEQELKALHKWQKCKQGKF